MLESENRSCTLVRQNPLFSRAMLTPSALRDLAPSHCFPDRKIEDVVPAARKGRFLILFSEYAVIDVPDAWDGGRNPVSYRSLKRLGLDPSKLSWKPMPERRKPAPDVNPAGAKSEAAGLTMAEAKKGLAISFGVKPDAIEIVIRG